MSASSTQSVILYAFLGRRVVPGKKCETKREQRREVVKVRKRNIFCWVLVLVLLSILVQAMALDYGSEDVFGLQCRGCRRKKKHQCFWNV